MASPPPPSSDDASGHRRLTALVASNLQRLASRARSLADDEPYITLQVGRRAFERTPRRLRTELWLSALARRGVGASAARSYADLQRAVVDEAAAADIDKDLARTFPATRRFAAGAEGLAALRRVLRAYAALDPEVGYTQGLNFVAAVLLSYLPEESAFAGLVLLMMDRGLRRYYRPQMDLLQAHLSHLSRLMPARLCAQLERLGVPPALYAASWLMTAYSSDFGLAFAARVMDALLGNDRLEAALLRVAVALLARAEPRLMQAGDLEEALTYLKQGLTGLSEAALHDVLSEAFGDEADKAWTPRQLEVLRSVEGAETVAEAQARIAAANLAAAAAAAAAAGATAAGESGDGGEADGDGGGGDGGSSSGAAAQDGGSGASSGGAAAAAALSVLAPPPKGAAAFRARLPAGRSGGAATIVGPGRSSSGGGALVSPRAAADGAATPAAAPSPNGAAAAAAAAAAAKASPPPQPPDVADLLGDDWQPFRGPSSSALPNPAAAVRAAERSAAAAAAGSAGMDDIFGDFLSLSAPTAPPAAAAAADGRGNGNGSSNTFSAAPAAAAAAAADPFLGSPVVLGGSINDKEEDPFTVLTTLQ